MEGIDFDGGSSEKIVGWGVSHAPFPLWETLVFVHGF